MLKILFKQLTNFWRSLEIRYKLEILTLVIIVFAVLGTKLSIAFDGWIITGATYIGILLFVSNIYSLFISISSLAIITWIIPHQKGLKTLLAQPLDSKGTIQALTFYCLKYLSLYIILLLPVLAAMISTIGLWSNVLSLTIIFVLGLFFLLSLFWLRDKFKTNIFFFLVGISVISLYYAGFTLFYWLNDYIVIYQAITLFLLFLISMIIYFNNNIAVNLENFVPFQVKVYQKKSLKRSSTRLPKIFPQTVQALFEKEYFSLWRNPKYKRLKLYTFAAHILFLSAVIINRPEHLEIWVTIISCIIIWVHYSGRFNEKYSFAEPAWFIRTLPIKIRHLFLSKYFNEIPLVTMIILIAIISFHLCSMPAEGLIFFTLFIMVFAHLVLFAMLNFQIMFFDNARLAEYAFNFSVLFFTIMIINYPLVGPLIAFCLIMFFFYKNVKYLNG